MKKRVYDMEKVLYYASMSAAKIINEYIDSPAYKEEMKKLRRFWKYTRMYQNGRK